jgi:hypothetical protein
VGGQAPPKGLRLVGAVAFEGSQPPYPVGEREARTDVATDMFMGRFSMMPNKRPSRTAARDESAASEVSTPRRIAGSGARRFATAAPSYSELSQHCRCLSLCTVEEPARARWRSPGWTRRRGA